MWKLLVKEFQGKLFVTSRMDITDLNIKIEKI